MAGLKKTNKSDELSTVVEQIQDENIRTLGDVPVDEEGFVNDEPLLAGYLDESTGELHTTFSYREMDTKDIETINKSELKANGAKASNVIVERCVTKIGSIEKKAVGLAKWHEIVSNMLIGDIDYMAVKIREISKGTEITFTHKCPTCKTKLDTIVDTSEFSIKPFKGLRNIPFVLPRGYRDPKGVVAKEGVLRYPNAIDRELMIPKFRKNEQEANTFMLTRLISFDNGAFVTTDCMQKMKLRDRDYLNKIIKENDFGVDTAVEIACSNCGADLSGEVGSSDFF